MLTTIYRCCSLLYQYFFSQIKIILKYAIKYVFVTIRKLFSYLTFHIYNNAKLEHTTYCGVFPVFVMIKTE